MTGRRLAHLGVFACVPEVAPVRCAARAFITAAMTTPLTIHHHPNLALPDTRQYHAAIASVSAGSSK